MSYRLNYMKKTSKTKTSIKKRIRKTIKPITALSPVELLCLEYKFKNNL